MSTGYVLALGLVVATVLGARLLLTALPLAAAAVRLAVVEALLLLAGTLGLAFHCGAMFFRDLVDPLPGARPAIEAVRELGTASIIWYVVPAGLVLLGLRRQHPAAVALVALALAAVGVTMYNGGPVSTHLAAIFTSVVVSAGVVALLVRPPWGAGVAGAEQPAG